MITRLAASLIGLLLLTGACSADDKPITDDAILAEVRARISDDPIARGGSITVECKSGVVTLSGTAENIDQRIRAFMLTKKVKGIKQVISNVIVHDLKTPDDAPVLTDINPRTPAAHAVSTPTDSNTQSYPDRQRLQISEPCPLVAKWLAQGFAAGLHWQLVRYDSDLGTLIFKIVGVPDLTKEQANQWVEGKSKHVHMEQVVFTLRSLVSSTLSFGDARQPEASACTIAPAFKYANKDGSPASSNGGMEALFLEVMKDRYAKRGLDY